MGHSHIRTTEEYLHSTDDRKVEAIRSLQFEAKQTIHTHRKLVVAHSSRRSHNNFSGNTMAGSVLKKEKFRPHHIFCERFLKIEVPSRGDEFKRVSQERRDTIERQDDIEVEVIQGIDELCRVCPDCQNERCQNPRGDERAVRKWDSIILRGLEIDYGETRTSKEWRRLINQKAPLKFCETRCPYHSICTVFQMR